MDKAELAAYLVNLHTIMDGQEALGGERSKALGQEYAARFKEFKDLIAEKEPHDEPAL